MIILANEIILAIVWVCLLMLESPLPCSCSIIGRESTKNIIAKPIPTRKPSSSLIRWMALKLSILGGRWSTLRTCVALRSVGEHATLEVKVYRIWFVDDVLCMNDFNHLRWELSPPPPPLVTNLNRLPKSRGALFNVLCVNTCVKGVFK